MKRIMALILTVFLGAGVFSGCAKEQPADMTQPAASGTEAEAAADTETDIIENESAAAEETSGKIYTWGDISFELTDVTEDLGDITVGDGMGSDLRSPEGKWVKVVLTVVEGEIESEALSDMLKEDGNVGLSDYTFNTYVIQGIRIDDSGDWRYATIYVGEDSIINLFFDVDMSYDIRPEDVYVKENVTVPAKETA